MPLYLFRINILGLPSNIFELITILVIAFLILKERKRLPEKFFDLPKLLPISIILILLGVLLSILFNDNYRAGFGILKSWFLVPLLFSFLLYAILESKTAVEKVFLSIYLSAALVGLIGLVYKISGIVTYDNRLTAFYLSPNYLSMYLSPGIFFGCYFLIKYFQLLNFGKQARNILFYRLVPTGTEGYKIKYFLPVFSHIVLLTFIFVPLYYTYSYGAWLAVFISLLATAAFVANKKRLLITGAFGMIILIIFIFQINTPKFSALMQFSERSSFASRAMIWDASLLMIKQRPLAGIGPGNFQATYLSLQNYFPPYLQWAVPEPHNLFLAFWTQAGMLGLVGFLLLLFFIFDTLWDILKNKKNAALAAPLLGYFVYIVLHGLVDTLYWKNDLAFLFWVSVFLLVYIYIKKPLKK